jgi:hypothetical protein
MRTYKFAITSIAMSPTSIIGLRNFAVPHRGQALAVSAIMPPHFRQEVIFILTSPCGWIRTIHLA